MATMATTTDTTQFSSVARHYHDMPALPEAEVLNVTWKAHVLESDVRGKRVLDLACGTGRWSRWACRAGAEEVVGVDLSPAMVDSAKRLSTTEAERQKLKYVVADCSQSLVGPLFEHPFDLIIAFCFLNYASSEEQMRDMWRVIAANLRQDARAVCLVPNLNLEDDFSEPIEPRYGTSFRKVEPVNVGRRDWGYKTRFQADTGVAVMEFDMYRLNREVYIRSAESAELRNVEFHSMQYPNNDELPTYWDEYKRRPHYELLTAVR